MPQSLFTSRPDTGQLESTRDSAFNPIGGVVTLFGSSTMNVKRPGEIGKLEVSTN